MRARGPFALVGLLAVCACDDHDDKGKSASAQAQSKGEPDKEVPTKAETNANPEPEPKAKAKLSGFSVVLDNGAVFDAAEAETSTKLPSAYAGGFAVRIVGEVGDRVEIETLDATTAADHCASPLSGLGDFRVRLFVARNDLAPVLRAPRREDFDDGTSLSIMPGAVVGAPVGGSEVLRPILAGAVATGLEVNDADLADAYDAPRPFALADPEGTLPATTKAKIGDDRLVVAGQFSVAGDDPSEVRHFGITESDGKHFVRLRNQCIEAVARLDAPPPEPESDEDDLPMGVIPISEMREPAEAAKAEDPWGGLTGAEHAVGSPAATKWRIEPGTKLVWPDGRPAGEVVAAHELYAEPKLEGATSCFDAPLVRHSETALRLCVPSSQVAKVEPAPEPEIPAAEAGTKPKGGSKVKGTLDKKDIKAGVAKGVSAVRSCYEKGLRKDPKLAGTVSVQFVIGGGGKVSSAVVAKSDLSDPSVANCVAKAVKKLEFPEPKGGGNVVVTYPFVLRPS